MINDLQGDLKDIIKNSFAEIGLKSNHKQDSKSKLVLLEK